MLDFPKSTEFNKRIPKQKFYEKIDVSPALKKVFVEQIKLIHWRNKLAESTLNIAPGQTVMEIEVIEIKLTQPQLDEAVLRQIDKEIPYHILFVLSYGNKVQAWTGYKEAAESGNNAFKVNKYYHTEWMLEDELTLEIEGLNMDAVWDNFIIQVGGLELAQGNSLEEQIALEERKAKLTKEIEKYSLDDKRSEIKENDIPDIIVRFHNREAEAARERTEQSFFVPKQEIVDNGYDLSINKYKKVEFEAVEYPSSLEIMTNLRELEMQIGQTMDELEKLLGL